LNQEQQKIDLLERVCNKFWTITWTSPHADKDYDVGQSFFIAAKGDKVQRIDKVVRGGARTVVGSNIDCHYSNEVLTISYAIGPHFVGDKRVGRPLELNFCFNTPKPYFVFEEYRDKGSLSVKRSSPKTDGTQLQKRGGHNKGGGVMT
jgi:hypothetical protein